MQQTWCKLHLPRSGTLLDLDICCSSENCAILAWLDHESITTDRFDESGNCSYPGLPQHCRYFCLHLSARSVLQLAIWLSEANFQIHQGCCICAVVIHRPAARRIASCFVCIRQTKIGGRIVQFSHIFPDVIRRISVVRLNMCACGFIPPRRLIALIE